MEILQFVFDLAITLLAIDFVSGFVHWAEDTFFTRSTPIVGKWVVAPNEVHHEHPTEFTKKNWWQSSWDLLLASTLILLAFWWAGKLNWQVWLFCFLGANANQLHKYAHLPSKSVPAVVRLFQKLRLIQNARDHAFHHSGDKNLAYCVITPYLNPFLDKIRFWRLLEWLTIPILGAARRKDLQHIPHWRRK